MRPQREVLLVANGDLRQSANVTTWPDQRAMEQKLIEAAAASGIHIVRAHKYRPTQNHGFIASQKEGMDVFSRLDPAKPLIVAEAVWQYSHHLLPGLHAHKGPILTVANWSGHRAGLVGVLNLNGSLTKAGIPYSTLWSETFDDPYFTANFQQWLKKGSVCHSTSHVTPAASVRLPTRARQLGERLADGLRRRGSIMGIFDEGCMGMYNAILPDDLVNRCGVFKERLSQSALYYATTQVSDEDAAEVYRWYVDHGFTFHFGPDEETHLTKRQVLLQCKLYIASARLADEFGCETIGIQYQQGLKDLLPASDLAEGTLNSSIRPPVRNAAGRRIRHGKPIPHFNEADEGSGLDALLISRVHESLGQPLATTLHDVRWGDIDRSGTVPDYIWVFLISGSAPADHHLGGWSGSDAHRQPPVYFRLGGGTLRGIAKPGEIVWSRIYVEEGRLKLDIGRAGVARLPRSETERRWNETNIEWPIMHAVTYGVSRDQMMARHKANHVQVAYAHSAAEADLALYTRVALAQALGIEVSFCGTRANGAPF